MSSDDKSDLADLARAVLRTAEGAALPLTPDPRSPDLYMRDGNGHINLRADPPALMAYVRAAVTAAPRLARAVLDGAAAMVEYRPGLPSVEDVRAHEERTRAWCEERGLPVLRGGYWLIFKDWPAIVRLRDISGDICMCGGGGGGETWLGGIESTAGWRPCLSDGTPTAWPIKNGDS